MKSSNKVQGIAETFKGSRFGAYSHFGLDFDNPDFVAYAKSYGAKGSRVGNASELSTMLEAAFRGGGVHLVVAPVDYSENMRVLVNELHSVVQAE